MGIFFSDFSLSFIATTLLASGVGHLTRPADFGRVVRGHGVFPSWLAGWIAIAVCLFELSVGAQAALSLRPGASFATRVATLAVAAGTGAAFWIYLRRLLSNAHGPTTCGCSPLSAPLTKASPTPSIGLVIVSVLGLLGIAAVGQDIGIGGLERVLACLWGITLSGMTLLYPAAVLQFGVRSAA